MAVFAVLMRLREICCDPRLIADNWTGGSAKLDACIELVTSAVEGGHHILLFSQFTSMLELWPSGWTKEGISHFTLQGSTPKPVRAELVRRFNGGEASVFLISLRAGGTGLNLTAADIVIHYDPWWNVAAQNQATDRAYRIGQQNPVPCTSSSPRTPLRKRSWSCSRPSRIWPRPSPAARMVPSCA